jgi:hypothetical protein
MNAQIVAAKLITAACFGIAGFTFSRADPWPFWVAVSTGCIALFSI